jgi:hypothetical protein
MSRPSPSRGVRRAFWIRSALIATVAGVLTTPPGAALAQSNDAAKKQCLVAYESGQRSRIDGHLVAAREQFIVCQAPQCPSSIAADCTRWFDELGAAIPSVIIAARLKDGGDVVHVRVTVDGRQMEQKLSGRPISLDPGAHRFRFETDGCAPIERELLIREREQARVIDVQFVSVQQANQAKQAPVASESGSSISAFPYVLAGVGIAGLAVFSYFGLQGNSKKSDLEAAQCAPNCAQSDVDSAKRDWLVANIGLGVGIVSLGLATWRFVADSGPASQPKVEPKVSAGIGWQGGPMAGVGGTF